MSKSSSLRAAVGCFLTWKRDSVRKYETATHRLKSTLDAQWSVPRVTRSTETNWSNLIRKAGTFPLNAGAVSQNQLSRQYLNYCVTWLYQWRMRIGLRAHAENLRQSRRHRSSLFGELRPQWVVQRVNGLFIFLKLHLFCFSSVKHEWSNKGYKETEEERSE